VAIAAVKIGAMCLELSRRINDPVAAVDTDGETLSATERAMYISKAMLKLFNSYWDAVKGDPKLFMQIFPELATRVSGVNLTSSAFSLEATGYYHHFLIVSGSANGKLLEMRPPHLLDAVISGPSQIKGTADYPVGIFINRTLTVYPTAIFTNQALTYVAIKIPVISTTGLPLDGVSAGEDSPFAQHWNDKIVTIAYNLFRDEAKLNQENSTE